MHFLDLEGLQYYNGKIKTYFTKTYAPLASPSFTGTPTSTTPSAGDSSTKIATTKYVQTELGTAKVASAGEFTAAKSVTLTGDVTGTTSSKGGWSIAATLASSGVTADTYGPSANASLAHSGTFTVPKFTVDAKGRVTSASNITITLPASGNVDTKVTQTVTANTDEGKYPILAKNVTAAATITDTSRFVDGITIQPSTGAVQATKFIGALEGNASTATKLATARNINGTSFNGTSAITTANWGTARNISISDSDGTNTGDAVSVNGSAAVTLKLPSTIKASLEGNASSADSVPWSGIDGKPSTFAPSSHNQASNTINAMTGYSKPSSTGVIATTDSLNAAIGKLEKALDGKQASGSYAAAIHNHDASNINSGTLNAARIPNLDASKITSGTIDIARLPAGALERLITVANQTARFALTTSDIQLGDTVRQSDTGLMYYVVDTSKLSSADGYAEYTAGAATSVPWSGVTGKPSTFAPSSHNQASSTINAMTGYSKPSSTSAIETSDTLNTAIGKLEKALDGKQASGSYATASHNQASSTINAMTGYSKPSSTSAIGTSDTLNAAIGKLEKALDGKAASATTLAGYNISDAKIASGVITLGSSTITPLTSSSSLNAAKLTGTASVSTTGNAATVTGTAGTSALSWNTETTLYTVGGHAIKAKLPANPNSDTKVKQYVGNTSTERPILSRYTIDEASQTANYVVYDTGVTNNPNKHTLTSSGGFIGKLSGTPEGTTFVAAVTEGKALVNATTTGYGGIWNAPTKNYRVGCSTHPSSGDDVRIAYSVTNANVAAGTNTVAKSLTWNADSGTLTATAFSGPLTGNVTGNVSGSSGSCTGNAATATKLATARTINGTNFDGSAAITTANWGTARNISISDSDGTNTGTAVSVNGSANATLKLPATIKASITGNVSGSSGSCTGNAATATKFASSQSITLTGAITGTASSQAGWSVGTIWRSCMVGQSGSTSTNPWYKVATFAATTANDDIIVTFLVEDTYSSHKQGILKVHVRTDGSKVISSTASDLIWLSHTGFTLADFVLVCPTAASSTVELWTKIATSYMYRRFTVLSEGSRSSTSIRWTLLNASSAGQAASITTTGTQIASTFTGQAASCTGNAATATKLATARKINGVSFDGSADITVADSTKLPLAGGTMTGNITMSASKSIIFDLSATTPTASTVRNFPIQFKSQSIEGNFAFTQNPFFEIPVEQTTNYGMGIGFGGSGLTIIGGGEAGRGIVAAESLTGGTEKIILASDGAIDFFTNCNTIANRVKTSIDTAGNFSGNSATATKLATARKINGVSFDGSADITVADSTKVAKAGDTMSGVLTISKAGEAMFHSKSTGNSTAANNWECMIGIGSSGKGGLYDNTRGYYIIERAPTTGVVTIIAKKDDKSATGTYTFGTDGKLTATTFAGALTGNVTGNVSGSSGSCTGNAATATKLATARTINGVSFDGSANITVADSTKVAKTGDTMTGNLTISKAGPVLVTKSTGMTRNTAPSAAVNTVEILGQDNAGKSTWGIYHTYGTDMANRAQLIAYNGKSTDNTWSGIGIGYDANGNVATNAPTPAFGDNTTKIATTAFVHNNAAKHFTAAQTIYVAKAATGNGSGSSTSNYMALADLRNYLATIHMHSSTADLSGSYSVTLLFKAGDSFGNASFDSNKLPGIRSIVINTSTGTTSTSSNYSTNSPTFGNITVTGNISATIRNVNCTGAISAQYGSYVLIDTYVAAAKLQASNHGYLNIAKNMIIDVVDAHTDYFVVATTYGLIAMWPGATVTLNFRNQCYYSRTLFCASTNGTLWLGYSSLKLTGTKPVSLWSGSGTLKGTSETTAGTAAKVVTLADGQTFTLETNATAKIKFTNDNTAANPTLNIGGTGAKAIWWNGAAAPANLVIKNFIYDVKYDGTHYVIQNAVKRLTNNDFGVFRTSGDYATTYNSGSWNFSDWTLYYGTGIENSTWRGSHIGNIQQNVTTSNNTYPVLFTGTANATANTSTYPYFGSGVKINPSTSTVYATTFSGNVTGSSGSCTGNASTATKLATARTIGISGGATGTATSFDGSGNITIPVTALDVSKASAGTLAVARGGTGLTSLDTFVRTTGNQTIAGTKTFSAEIIVNKGDKPAAGALSHAFGVTYHNTDGTQTHTAHPISVIGTSNADNAYNTGVRLGSLNGTTVVSAGESGGTFCTKLSKFDDETLYLEADGEVQIYCKCANDMATYAGPIRFYGSANDSGGTTTVAATNFAGNASTATKLATARSLWGNNFDGSAAISGSITISAAAGKVVTKNSNVTRNTAPSANQWNQGLCFQDKNGVALGGVEHGYLTDKTNRLNLIVYKGTTTDTSANAQISIGYDKDGNAFTAAPTPATADNSTKIATTAFVKAQGYITSSGTASNVSGTVAIANGGTGATTRLNALKALTNENVGSSANYFLTITTSWGKGGYTSVADAKTALGLKSAAYTESSAYATSGHTHNYVPLAGGTMTGNLTISKSAPALVLKNTGKTRNTAPSAAVNTVDITCNDSADKRLWGIYHTYGTDKSARTQLITYKGTSTDNTWAGIGIGYDASGNAYTNAPTPAAGDNSTKIATTAWVTTYVNTTWAPANVAPKYASGTEVDAGGGYTTPKAGVVSAWVTTGWWFESGEVTVGAYTHRLGVRNGSEQAQFFLPVAKGVWVKNAGGMDGVRFYPI